MIHVIEHFAMFYDKISAQLLARFPACGVDADFLADALAFQKWNLPDRGHIPPSQHLIRQGRIFAKYFLIELGL